MNGIHQIQISSNNSCYFIKRPFGNLLIFADNLVELTSKEHELFKAYGGISKTFLESTQSINEQHRSLFTKYGAAVVCDTIKNHFDEGARVERLKDFSDPQIEFIFKPQYKLIILKQDNNKIMFVGNDLLFKEMNVLYDGRDITTDLLQLKNEKSIDLIYFTRFEGQSAIKFNQENVISKITSFFSSLTK